MLNRTPIVEQMYDQYYSRPDLGEGDMLGRRFRIVGLDQADWVLWSAVFDYHDTALSVAHLLRDLPFAKGFYYLNDDLLMLLVPKADLGYLLHMIMAYDYVPESLPAFVGLKDTAAELT